MVYEEGDVITGRRCVSCHRCRRKCDGKALLYHGTSITCNKCTNCKARGRECVFDVPRKRKVQNKTAQASHERVSKPTSTAPSSVNSSFVLPKTHNTGHVAPPVNSFVTGYSTPRSTLWPPQAKTSIISPLPATPTPSPPPIFTAIPVRSPTFSNPFYASNQREATHDYSANQHPPGTPPAQIEIINLDSSSPVQGTPPHISAPVVASVSAPSPGSSSTPTPTTAITLFPDSGNNYSAYASLGNAASGSNSSSTMPLPLTGSPASNKIHAGIPTSLRPSAMQLKTPLNPSCFTQPPSRTQTPTPIDRRRQLTLLPTVPPSVSSIGAARPHTLSIMRNGPPPPPADLVSRDSLHDYASFYAHYYAQFYAALTARRK